jgi:ABC-type nickel/cobalt efflux system permease component RcnA
MMELYGHFMQKLVEYQYQINGYISQTIRSLNDENSFSTSLLILGIAFLYGLVHAIGPGHGKALVALYFTSNKSDYKKAFKMGYLISIIHAVSALLFTFGIFFILKTMFRQHFGELTHTTMLISAVMIIGVGLYLTYEAYSDKGKIEKKEKVKSKSELGVAFSAGVVPCPGVMTIVLFNIVLGHYALGVAAAIAMSIGMGLTISLAGIFSIAINKKTTTKLDKNSYLLEMLGGLLIVLLGTFLLVSALSQGGVHHH